MNTPKRLLIYVVSFITLNVFAFGLSSLVGWMLDLIGIIGDSQPQNIAPFIAAIIVCFLQYGFIFGNYQRETYRIFRKKNFLL